MIKKITSVNNEYIKELSKLKQNKYRNQQQLFLVEGYHLVNEAKAANLLQTVLITNEEDYLKGINNILVSNNIIEKLAHTSSPQGIIGVVKMMQKPKLWGNKILLLDNVQDPGNIGTLIRTALGFNLDLIVLGNGCADLYNDKTIRATQGAIFKIPILQESLDIVIPQIKQMQIPLFGTSLTNAVKLESIPKSSRYALILGNEGSGVNPKYLQMTDQNIYVKTNENLESLNVGVAGGIIMYYFNNSLD